MPICKRIVEEHKGTFEIRSEQGKGTHVLISLPRGNGCNAAALKEE